MDEKKAVLITGASSGIGKEIAKIFLQKNYSLVLSGRNEKGFDYARGKANVDVVLGDITKNEIRKKIQDVIINKYKRLDILINNAGITFIQPFEENTEKQLNAIFETNLKAPMLLTHDLYEIMKAKKNGTIIFMNSSAGKQGYPNHTMYSAMKFGLNGFAQSLRQEAKKYGIRVISVHPGGVNTALYNKLREKPDVTQYMNPQKIAEIVVYLSETSELSPDEITINRTTK
jgi:NADP-dependent 3-hydroxy acid dehydrogenase YdfG